MLEWYCSAGSTNITRPRPIGHSRPMNADDSGDRRRAAEVLDDCLSRFHAHICSDYRDIKQALCSDLRDGRVAHDWLRSLHV